MKILLVNKFHYFRGGSEKYYFELGQLLMSHGHTVGYFSMEHKENITTGNKEYFVEEIDMNTGSKLKAFDVIYSSANKKIMEKALDEFKPDIVHVNNFQRQLTISVVEAANKRGIPVVMTAHDFNPICPASIMLYDGKICEDCIRKGYMSCIKKSCIKGSMLKSIIGVLENKFYRMKNAWTDFDTIVAPSQFVNDKLSAGGLNIKDIQTIHNFVNRTYVPKNVLGDYALYSGRLSAEKGINTLIEAMATTDGKLLIAGDGPEKENINKFIEENSLQDKVELLGYLNQDEMRKYISNCRFVVVPSIWYENCPYSILEAMEIGKPVIGSNMGGIPELVCDGKNGFLFEAGNVEQLKEKMSLLFGDDELAKEQSKNALEIFEENYTSEKYYEKIMDIYNNAIDKRQEQ